MTVHVFSQSLNDSASYRDADWWEPTYERAFGRLAGCQSVNGDGWAQRGGVDRVLTLTSGKTLTVDEKVRSVDYEDFALEFWSDRERRRPGWVATDLACDYIAYAFIPSRRCYLLPFLQLRQAWRTHYREWVDSYREPWHVARNEENGRSWETWFVPVPIEAVMASLTAAMLVEIPTVEWAA